MKKLIILLLALTLALSACSKTPGGGPDEPDEPSGPSSPEPEEPRALDPKEVILAAFDASEADLKSRFAASRLNDLSKLANLASFTARYALGIPDDSGELLGTAEGTLTYERLSGRASLTVSLPDLGFDGELYYSPEFLGFTSDKLRGDVYYGLVPSDMASQLEGTPFAELFELDLDSVRELDALLESVPTDIGVYREGAPDAALRLTRELIESMTLELAETSGGYELTGEISPDALADYLDSLAALIPALDAEAAVEEIRASAAPARAAFTVYDGKLTHLAAEFEDYRLDAELYGGDGSTISVALDPLFTLELSLSGGVTLSVRSDSVTDLDWAEDGAFTFITSRNDITDLALEGSLAATDTTLDFDGIWYSGERGDRNPLTLSLASGGEVTEPSATRDIGELTTRDLYRIIAGFLLSFAR